MSGRMRVIILSWEYPPRIIGGIARHVDGLAHALVRQGAEVHVVTCEHPGALAEEVEDGIFLHRVTPATNDVRIMQWVQGLNDALYTRADSLLAALLAEGSHDPDPLVLHAHDWLVCDAAVRLKEKYGLPLIATIHATEYGRNIANKSNVNDAISSIERKLIQEARRVIVCSAFMKSECFHALHTPWEKMDVIYNGVDPEKFILYDFDASAQAAFRAKYARPQQKLICFVGRIVREKGIEELLQALPKVLWYHDVQLVICGRVHGNDLHKLAIYYGVERHVVFNGFTRDGELAKIYQAADVACFPSLYEAFGIVALEAMVSHVPVVVSDAGGLPEVVANGACGIITRTGDPESLADGLLRVLHEPDTVPSLTDAAYRRVLSLFDWNAIAAQTLAVYEKSIL